MDLDKIYTSLKNSAGYVLMGTGMAALGLLLSEVYFGNQTKQNLATINEQTRLQNGYFFFESTAFQVDIKNQTATVHFIGNAKQSPQDRKTITAFTHEFSLNLAKNFLQKTKTVYDYGEGSLLFIKTYPNSVFEQSFYKLTRDLLTVSNEPATRITTLANKDDVNALLEEYSQFSIIPIGDHEAYMGVCKDDGEHTKSELLHFTHSGNLYEDISKQKINFTVVEEQESILPNNHTKM